MWFLYILAGFTLAVDAFALKTAIKNRKNPVSDDLDKELLETPPARLRFSLSFFALIWSFFFLTSQATVDLTSMTLAAFVLTILNLTIAITGIMRAGTPRIVRVSTLDNVLSRLFLVLSAVYSVAFLYLAATGR